MAQRLTTFSKFLITLLIVAIIGFGARWALQNTEAGQKIAEQAEQVDLDNGESTNNTNSAPTKNIPANSNDVLTVQVFTWGGIAPGLYFNGGGEPNKNSRFKRDYGLDVRFELIDDFDASRQAWIGDKVDVLSNEVSAMNTEMERLAPHDPRVFMQYDWSRGGDAVVVRRGIKSVNDLRGKKVAFAGFTPSVTFLVTMLESANMTMADIEAVEVPLPTDAANAYKAGQVDAAIVWSPDDLTAKREVPGTTILQSTREASNIIADVFMVKDAYAKANKDKLEKFYAGWMKAVAEMSTVPSNYKTAGKYLSDFTGLPMEDAIGMMDNVRFVTHGDNRDFMGQNTSFKGMTGKRLYEKMGREFEKLKQAPAQRPTWRQVGYPSAITAAANLTGNGFQSEGQKAFKPVTKALETAQEIASKPISISFASAKSELTENAKTIIDLQFAEVAKAYSNTRIRIEGNTDSDGNDAMNQKLSLKRAQSVAKYLTKEYGMNSNRFIIIGNGEGKPVPGCESNATADCKAKNRRTEFQLVAG
ncbi:MAG: phosphate ABC transporter substrate-binding/OmpA family protein [Saprospiraceae bacterium]